MRLHLTLYIAGADTARSVAAKRRLEELMGRLDADVHLDVVDVLEAPDLAELARVFATPTLVREMPAPPRRVIGDLSDLDSVTAALGLAPHAYPKVV